MSILGINSLERPSVALVDNARVRYGKISPNAITFARLHTSFDTVVSTRSSDKSLFKLKNFELVDYREALSYAAIATRSWSSCAIIVIDSIHTSLGYYADKQFHWLKDFEYPNSLALFYSAATRLLGFDPASEEHRVRAIALRGQPIYAPWISENVLKHTAQGYQLLHNLEYGVGTTHTSPDIAASVEHVYASTLLHLANWLSSNTNLRNLVVVGRGAANYATNSILRSSAFEDIAFSPISGVASTSIGAACLLTGAAWKNVGIGDDTPHPYNTEEFALLLRSRGSQHITSGPTEFADSSYTTNVNLKIPNKQALDNLREDSVLLCSEANYSKYFKSNSKIHTGHILSECLIPWFPKEVRVVTIANNSNPYIARVLSVLESEQQPILISEPL